MKTAAVKIVSCGMLGLGLLFGSGCKSLPSPVPTLQEARATIEAARMSPTADPKAIDEAEGALSYAENEYRLAPDHPLSHARAERALQKAKAALGVQSAATEPGVAAH